MAAAGPVNEQAITHLFEQTFNKQNNPEIKSTIFFPSLKVLHGYHLTNDQIIWLAHHLPAMRIITLCLANCKIETSGMQSLAKALSEHKILTNLYLENCGLNSEALHLLSMAIEKNPTYKSISLSSNPNMFNDGGLAFEQFCKAIAYYTSTLDMSNNKLHGKDIIALKYATKVIDLKLDGNFINSEPEGLAALAVLLKQNNFESLSLAHNWLSEADIITLLWHQPSNLKRLNLSYNQIANNGFNEAKYRILARKLRVIPLIELNLNENFAIPLSANIFINTLLSQTNDGTIKPISRTLQYLYIRCNGLNGALVAKLNEDLRIAVVMGPFTIGEYGNYQRKPQESTFEKWINDFRDETPSEKMLKAKINDYHGTNEAKIANFINDILSIRWPTPEPWIKLIPYFVQQFPITEVKLNFADFTTPLNASIAIEIMGDILRALKLQSLAIANQKVPEFFITSILRKLDYHTHLQILILNGNGLTKMESKEMAQNNKFFPNLRILNVENNHLDDTSIEFFNAFSNHKNLRYVNLKNNKISAKGIRTLKIDLPRHAFLIQNNTNYHNLNRLEIFVHGNPGVMEPYECKEPAHIVEPSLEEEWGDFASAAAPIVNRMKGLLLEAVSASDKPEPKHKKSGIKLD